mgnify:CR=1 FL=1
MQIPSLVEMLEAGVHFGHQTRRWNPKMRPYIYGERNGIYIIDLEQTTRALDKACEFVRKAASEKKNIIFVGTKKQAAEIVEEEARRCGAHFVNRRWLGGMLTNYQTVKASIDRLKKIEALKGSEEWNEVPKKMQARYGRDLDKLQKSLGGIQDMKKLPGAIFVIDTEKEHIAVKEAKKLGIPTIAVVDTNCDPSNINYVIPGNDDAIRAGDLMARIICDAVEEGRQIRARRTGAPVVMPRTVEEDAAKAQEQAEARRQAAAQAAQREARVAAAKEEAAAVADEPAETPAAEAPADAVAADETPAAE